MSLRTRRICSHGSRCAGRSRVGFTLIELLVVLAITMLLISLLLPALGGAREVARAAACLSNQRQILTALANYLNGNRDVVPREGSVDLDSRYERDFLSWAVALRPYLDERVSASDDLNDLFAYSPYYRDPSRARDGHKIHFMVNAMPFLSKGTVDTAPNGFGDYRYRRGPTPLPRLRFPEQTAYIGEYANDVGGAIDALINALPARDIDRAQYYDVWAAEHILPGPEQRIIPRRHGDGGNVGFLDGHCKATPAAELIRLDTWDDRDYGRRRNGSTGN